MKKIFTFIFLSFICVSLFSSCSGRIVSEPFEQSKEFAEQGLTTTYIFAKGKVLVNPMIASGEKRRAESREAAIESARENMLALIEGSYINDSLMVARLVESDEFLEKQIAIVIEKNSRTIRTVWENGECSVIIRMPREALKSVGITLVK